jgi:transposase
MIPTRTGEDLLAGMWVLLSGWGGVPRMLVWDNEGAVGSWKGGRPQLSSVMQGFRGVLGIAVRLCRPADPEAKGLVERANGYLETSFLPGRSFASPQDFNAQLVQWLVRANARVHRRLDARPVDRWEPDRAGMLPLPPVPPQVGWRASLRLPRDHYVRVDANDYSVDPAVIGRRVDIYADLEQVQVRCQERLVATHVRCWARGQSITDPEHAEAAKALRAARRLAVVGPVDTEVEQRDLADYDRHTGVEVAA